MADLEQQTFTSAESMPIRAGQAAPGRVFGGPRVVVVSGRGNEVGLFGIGRGSRRPAKRMTNPLGGAPKRDVNG
jgi:hypothetical protein